MHTYTLCAHCDHFVDLNPSLDVTDDGTSGQDRSSYSDTQDRDSYALAPYIHLDDGEKEHDHDAAPSDRTHTLAEWQQLRPELFERDPSTGRIGPNRFGRED